MSKLGRAPGDGEDSPHPCSDDSESPPTFPESARNSTKGSPALPLSHHRHIGIWAGRGQEGWDRQMRTQSPRAPRAC